MTTKTTHHPNGFIEMRGCPNCDEAPYLWFYDGQWRIDTDDGYLGPAVNYCPRCGMELTPPIQEKE